MAHLPVTTQDVLRVSPVPLHSGQITWPLPLQRGQVAVSTVEFDASIVPPLRDLGIPRYSCQRQDEFEKEKPTTSRSVSLLTPRCPSDHMQAVVQRPRVYLDFNYCFKMGHCGLEPQTSVLSGLRSNQLS